MKFSTRQDIEAPIEYVFERAADFESHARQAMRRGVDVERTDEVAGVGIGMCWNVGFDFRGKPRRVLGELAEFDVPNSYLIQSVSGGILADFDVELLPLSRNRTRLKAGLQLSPKTLPARLLVRSLKLAKGNLDERFQRRILQFATDIQVGFARR
jgi:hypothetical protein